MVFGFLKSLSGPEGGYWSVQASYDKHYRLAASQGIEPVSMGLFGALGSRYKLRRKFLSDMVHMIEIAPFVMMDEATRVHALADYLMADEIPAQIDIQALRFDINKAIATCAPDNSAFELLASAEAYLSDLPIRWIDWLTDSNRARLKDHSA